MDEVRVSENLILNHSRTMMPSPMQLLKTDIMECKVPWCRFVSAKSESLERPKHRHLVSELHFILDGDFDYSFPQFGNYTVKKGHFMLIPRDTLHSTASKNAKTEYLVIAFSAKSNNEAINIIFSQGSKPISAPFSPSMEEMITALRLKTAAGNYSDGLAVGLMVHSVVFEAVDIAIETMGLKQQRENTAAHSDPRVSNIERIVRDHMFSQKLRGEAVAEELQLTLRQLNRICNRYLDCSINQYITKVRIEAMKELLSQSYYTLRDIAALFGFTDVYAFIKHFTKYAGISPGKYRMLANADIGDLSEDWQDDPGES